MNTKNKFYQNTMIILVSSLLIKVLGLLNKIIITRMLGEDGMSIYTLAFPTILLLISISGLSLNNTLSKLVSESIKNKKYSPKKLLKSSIKLSLIVSFLTILLLLVIINPLVNIFLKNNKLFFPILASIFLIPLVGISDALRGFFNGLKDMKTSSISTLLEQSARIISSFLFIFLFLPYGPIVSVVFCVISLSIGEIASIIYTWIKIKKSNILDYPSTENEDKGILTMAVPLTFSRLISSFAFFLEPIIFTFILLKLSYPQEIIFSTFTSINAYVIPLITMASFVSTAISTSIIPNLSESYTIKDDKSIQFYLRKAIVFSLIPAIVGSIIIFTYSNEYMNFLYGVSTGANIVKYSIFFMIPYYLQMPFTAILQSLGKSKMIFILSIILNILRLLLIIILSIIPIINFHSLIISIIITIFIGVLIMFNKIVKITKYRINKSNLISLLLLFFTTFVTSIVIKLTKINFIFGSLIILIIAFFISIYLKLFDFPKKKNSSKG